MNTIVSLSKKKKSSFNLLILAGGYGTRLYPLTLEIPKPLLKIGSKRVIDFAIDKFKGISQLKKIFVVTNAKFYREFLVWKKGSEYNSKIHIINDGTKTEKERLGSIGDLYFTVKKKKVNSDLLVIAGDNIFEMCISDFLDFAHDRSPHPSIGVFDVKQKRLAQRYGIVDLDKAKKIIGFEEKPRSPKSTLAAMCVYFFPKRSLHLLKEYVRRYNSDTAGNYIRWLSKKDRVYAFKFRGCWLDIGQMDTYKQAKKKFERLAGQK